MSKYNRQIINNSVITFIQIIVVSLSVFYLYRYIIFSIGIEKLGLWSLILSVTSLANIGNFGFTGSLVKYSAELSIRDEYKVINAILNASVVSIIILLMVLLSSVYFLSFFFLEYIVEDNWLEISRGLLFYALLSLFINIIASLYFSILEGLNLSFLKSVALIFATIIYVALSILLLDKFDLMGLAYAQLVQAISFLIMGLIMSKIYIPNFKLLFFKWHKSLMKDVYSYGFNFQLIGISLMLYDPITKTILSKYVGLDFVGIFELATKLVKQIRALTSGAIQNLIPKIVKINRLNNKEKIIDAYKKINNINLILTFSTLVLLIPLSKSLSIILIDQKNMSFIIVLICLTIGWFISSVAVPAYMVNLGTTNLKWNVMSHILIGILNFLLCLIVAHYFGNGVNVVLSWVFSLILGSLIIIYEFHKRNKISFNETFNKMFFKLFFLFLIISILSFILMSFTDRIILLLIINGALFLVYFLLLFQIKQVKYILNYIFRQAYVN